MAHPLTEKFIALEEKDLTENIIMPFLKTIKYSRVEYYGGVYEEGKDIICWGIDEFDQTILAVAQVKKYRPTASASDNRSFGEVVTQLQQCCEKKVPNLIDGKEYTPTKIYFFTPYPIDTRALQTRFEGYQKLRERQVQIVDGDLLGRKVEQTLPDITRSLLGDHYHSQKRIVETLNNKDLLNALQCSSIIDISKIYSDLDFCVGGISSTKFSSYHFSSKKLNINLNNVNYEKLKNKVTHIMEKFKINIFSDSIENIEKKYNAVIQHNKNIRENIVLLNKKKKKSGLECDKLSAEISFLIEMINLKLEENTLKGKSDFENLENFTTGQKIIKLGKENRTEEKFQKDSKKYDDSISYFEIKFLKTSNYKIIIRNIEKIISIIEKLNNEIQKLTKSIMEECYSVEIDSNDLVYILSGKQKWIKRKSQEFNKKKPTIDQLRVFLLDCQILFEIVDGIISDPTISQSIGLGESGSKSVIKPKNEERFSLSIHSIFETGLNIILLGGAGAGKTTSIQMYTKNQLENTNKKVFYLPLARALSTSSCSVDPNIPTVDSLQKVIVNFLKLINPRITQLEFEKTIYDNDSIFMFDGIDEVVGLYQWITHAINAFSNRFKKAQIIISSRFGGKYFEELPLLSIQLLPFTDKQREKFIKSWFEENESVSTAEIIEHLNTYPEIGEIVRTPLLATILCVLAEFKVPLPESEIRLYEERMKLLLGHYDTHKGIKRIKLDSQILEFIARKLAFDFHSKGIRHLSYDRLIQATLSLCKDRYSEEVITTAVNELIDPCNVIVAMTNNGELGFEHLRYQEFLTAKELILNRSIQQHTITKLLHDASWRGALVLFSKMTDDLEFLITDVLYNDRASSVYETLSAMIVVRPQNEMERLLRIIDAHYRLDAVDSIIFQKY